MGCAAERPAPWLWERHITDTLEGLALLFRAVAAAAGVTLADLDPLPTAPPLVGRGLGPDQRWRGASGAVVVQMHPEALVIDV